jgi:hypothetical protein
MTNGKVGEKPILHLSAIGEWCQQSPCLRAFSLGCSLWGLSRLFRLVVRQRPRNVAINIVKNFASAAFIEK